MTAWNGTPNMASAFNELPEPAMTRECYDLIDRTPTVMPLTVVAEFFADIAAPWRDRAACKGMGPAMFYLEGQSEATYAPAKTVCAGCLVRTECAEAGRNELHGLWGGLAPRDRYKTRGCSGCGAAVAKRFRWCPGCAAGRRREMQRAYHKAAS